MFDRLRRKMTGRQAATAGEQVRPGTRLPDGQRVYAVGDVHGRADLLARLHEMILEDAATAPEQARTIVYLGDLIDRGMESRGVVEMVLQDPPEGFEAVHILGNHEAAMLDFLEDSAIGPHWMLNGGDMTLYSYGVAVPRPGGAQTADFVEARKALQEKLPAPHLRFLKRMVLAHAAGDYLFVHAGLRPGVALADQKPEDLLWIREPFLSSDQDLGHVVVHGHTISEKVEERRNRIGIDTGAYHSGRLTCLVLAGDSRTYLQT